MNPNTPEEPSNSIKPGERRIERFEELAELKDKPILIREGAYVTDGVLVYSGDEVSPYRYYTRQVVDRKKEHMDEPLELFYGSEAISERITPVYYKDGSPQGHTSTHITYDHTRRIPPAYTVLPSRDGEIDLMDPIFSEDIADQERLDRTTLFTLEIAEGLPFPIQLLLGNIYSTKEFFDRVQDDKHRLAEDLRIFLNILSPITLKLRTALAQDSTIQPERKASLEAFISDIKQAVIQRISKGRDEADLEKIGGDTRDKLSKFLALMD